jgi:hypothetical protein
MRKAYDQNMIERMARLTVNFNHPDWDDEQVNKEAKKEEHIQNAVFNLTVMDLRDKLLEEYGDRRTLQFCADDAKYIMMNIPKELIVNVNEYIDGMPLSDIKIHGVSINDVINGLMPRRVHVVQVFKCMAKWKEYEYFDERFCWNYFALA